MRKYLSNLSIFVGKPGLKLLNLMSLLTLSEHKVSNDFILVSNDAIFLNNLFRWSATYAHSSQQQWW
jgi:hypothetical protein